MRALADKDLAHYARFGLESNPSKEVDTAFRKALGELTGRQLVGVINSVAVRKDTEAVDALLSASAGDDDEVAGAALSATDSPVEDCMARMR